MNTSCNKQETASQSINLINTDVEDVGKNLNQLEVDFLFPSALYKIEKPEFLPVVRKIAKKYLDKLKKEVELDPIYPVYQTENINYEPEMLDFSNYVAQTAWNVLNDQGYSMENLQTYFESMWVQEHYKHSAMEQHIHGYGAQIVGFYFLDVPEGSSRVVFHDPRPGKVQINLPETDSNIATFASTMINFEAKPGMMMFTNASLAHSFTRNSASKPMRFVHFNVAVRYSPNNGEQDSADKAQVI